MENRYQLITVYNDFSCKTETTSDLSSILRAIAIYYEEPDVTSISVYDWETAKDIIRIEKN